MNVERAGLYDFLSSKTLDFTGFCGVIQSSTPQTALQWRNGMGNVGSRVAATGAVQLRVSCFDFVVTKSLIPHRMRPPQTSGTASRTCSQAEI